MRQHSRDGDGLSTPPSHGKLVQLGLTKHADPVPYTEQEGGTGAPAPPRARKLRWFTKERRQEPVVAAAPEQEQEDQDPQKLAALHAAMRRVGFSVDALLTSLNRIDHAPAEVAASDAAPPTYVGEAP